MFVCGALVESLSQSFVAYICVEEVSKEIISSALVAPSSKRNSFVEQGTYLSKKNALSTGLY